jgi:chemotaxis protein MotB
MKGDGAATHTGETIIIVRRKAHGDHGHHGGAWKIAYADFVTAMMAFFLVMWLINAANEKTKAQVASYFNPVKLTDTSTSKKGLNEPTKNTPPETPKEKSAETEDKKAKSEHESAEKDAQQAQFKEEQLFKNPYGVLAQLAGQAIQGVPAGHSAKGLAIVEIADPGHRGGSAYRDPFDPFAWKQVPNSETPGASLEMGNDPAEPPASPAKQVVEDISPAPSKIDEDKAALPPLSPVDVAQPVKAKAVEKIDNVPQQEMEQDSKAEKTNAARAVAIRAHLIESLKQFDPEKNPSLDVKQTKEGVLISLTDSLNFDMFAVGSAEPTPQLVVLMEKVALTLRDYKGRIVIRGHTDSRRFRSRDYDNWRLSTARAQMAYYMLMRSGVDENSVERIEGYADRVLKIPDKPESAGNRRIEILLKVDET